MKENLIVARLRNKQFVAAVERGDDVSEWPDDDSFIPDSVDSQRSDSDDVEFEEEEESASVDGSEKDDGVKKERTTPQSTDNSMHPVPSAKATIGSTLEEDEQFESEMFENRQLFLNYCQTNHCQFDEMRRAKHSTMMVLFQLHNPTAPKFVQQCGACHRDIVSGNKFHCNVCPNFDLCQDCYLPFATGGRTSRFIHERAHTFSRISFGASVNGAEARNKGNAKQEDKTKTLNAYLEVLSHAAHCEGPPSCRLNNCVKMKQLFVHVQTCQTTHSFGCKICARLLSLIIVHARSCTVRGEKCPLPYCDKIRERNERLRRHQLYMDDRRRQAQNAFYHAGEG
jgi:E1A/CREB-binding protein